MDDIEAGVNALAINVASTVQAGLTIETPVDTSRALSNWRVNLGSRSDFSVLAHFPGERGSTYSSSGSMARALARSVLTARIPGQPIYISNAVRYIIYLNDGSSSQAPAGFVQTEVSKGRKLAAKGLRNVRRTH